MFRSDHIVLLAECPAVSHAVIDINDVQLRLLFSSDDELSDVAVLWSPVWSPWRSFVVL